MKLTKSLKLLEKAKTLIPFASQTFSKSYKWFPFPIFAERGEGCYLYDIDNNKYIDYICGLGTITLGYHYIAVDNAVKKQLDKGVIFSLPSELETQLSEIICKIIPSSEMVRFFKSGSEACQGAVRLAKAYTGKDKIISWGYHGWLSEFAIGTERPAGIPKEFGNYLLSFEYNNIDSLEKQFSINKDIAAVIMEPVIATPPKPNFINQVKELCKLNNSLLIFDEVVTGCRWSLGGASEYFGIQPDLIVLGKGIGNGFPISVVCGSEEIMGTLETKPVFISGTFYGDCISIAATIATIETMIDKDTINHCWEIGKRFRSGLKAIGVKTEGYDCRPYIIFPEDTVEKTKLIEQLLNRGILIHPGGLVNFCYSHTTKDIDLTLNRYSDALNAYKTSNVSGNILGELFKRL